LRCPDVVRGQNAFAGTEFQKGTKNFPPNIVSGLQQKSQEV